MTRGISPMNPETPSPARRSIGTNGGLADTALAARDGEETPDVLNARKGQLPLSRLDLPGHGLRDGALADLAARRCESTGLDQSVAPSFLVKPNSYSRLN